jgi:hypothetical protein
MNSGCCESGLEQRVFNAKTFFLMHMILVQIFETLIVTLPHMDASTPNGGEEVQLHLF